MFESLYWMFKQEDFKKHLIFLIKLFLFFYLFAFVQMALVFNLSQHFLESAIQYVTIAMYASFAVAFVSFAIPVLFLCGYFWELISSIIDRKIDVEASNIYSNNIKTINKICLPELSVKTCVWRGISSFVAILLLVLPIIMWLNSETLRENDLWKYNYNILYIFMAAFIPALLWNYAKVNSVFSMLNIRKAVYIMGNYTSKYILNTFVIVVIYSLILLIIKLLNITLPELAITTNISEFFVFFVKSFLLYISFVYFIYVYAHLIATIAPHSEF